MVCILSHIVCHMIFNIAENFVRATAHVQDVFQVMMAHSIIESTSHDTIYVYIVDKKQKVFLNLFKKYPHERFS